MLRLIDADKKYIDGYKEAYLLQLKAFEEGLISNHDLMFKNPDEVDIVKRCMDHRDITKLASHHVPSYDYFAVDDDKFIGVIHIRTRLTEELLQYGGHIGYAVNPKYWKMGYGTEILRLGLIKAKELVQEDKILITCDDDNIGSYKIIEANGGKLENVVENEHDDEKFLTRRYWIDKEM